MAEALGKYQTQLVEDMGLEELQYWIAVDMLKDEDFANKMKKESQQSMTPEQEAVAIKDFFAAIT